jgi:hypothetical protein
MGGLEMNDFIKRAQAIIDYEESRKELDLFINQYNLRGTEYAKKIDEFLESLKQTIRFPHLLNSYPLNQPKRYVKHLAVYDGGKTYAK